MRRGGRHLELAEALFEVRGILLDGRQGMRGPDRLPVKAVEPGHHAGIIMSFWSSVRAIVQEAQSLSKGQVRRGN